jgi:hypothetical protein
MGIPASETQTHPDHQQDHGGAAPVDLHNFLLFPDWTVKVLL